MNSASADDSGTLYSKRESPAEVHTAKMGCAPLSLLIAEDSAIVRERLVALIDGLDLGIAIRTANDGEHALQLFKAEIPHVVVLDLVLPGRSGFDVLTEFKRCAPRCVVVVATSYAYAEFKANALRLGADYFFSKTHEFERVLDVVADLGRSRQPAA